MIKPPSIQPLAFEFSREHLLLPLNPDRASGDPIRCLSAGVHADATLDNLSLFLDAPLELIPTPESELRDAITRTYQDQMAHSDALRQTSPSNTPEPDRLTVQEALHSLRACLRSKNQEARIRKQEARRNALNRHSYQWRGVASCSFILASGFSNRDSEPV